MNKTSVSDVRMTRTRGDVRLTHENLNSLDEIFKTQNRWRNNVPLLPHDFRRHYRLCHSNSSDINDSILDFRLDRVGRFDSILDFCRIESDRIGSNRIEKIERSVRNG
jgi:hypothetical protein